MSKIVQAVNAMIINSDRINSVIKGAHPTEYFFKYGPKHSWSIFGRENDYCLNYYPDTDDLEPLAAMQDDEWQNFTKVMTYKTKDIGTREGLESFKELHSVVKEKIFGMDEVLDDIIEEDIPF